MPNPSVLGSPLEITRRLTVVCRRALARTLSIMREGGQWLKERPWPLGKRMRPILTALAGLILAAVPVAGVNFMLHRHIESEGLAEVQSVVKKAIGRAEWRIDQALVGMSELSSVSVESCSDVDLGELRRAVMTITPVKEMSIVGPDGGVRCAHLGLGNQTLTVSREIETKNDPGVLLAVIRLSDRNQRGIRIRWNRASEPLSLAAMLPADMFLPDNNMASGPEDPGIRLMLSEGSLLVGGGPAVAYDDGTDRIYARAESERYPIIATASISRNRLLSDRRDIQMMFTFGSFAFAGLIIIFVFVAPWRERANPITEIEQALEANEFVPYFQPIIDLRTGRFAAAEVLVRWRKPDGTIVSPASFIPLAESTGLILNLTRSLMRAVRDQAGAAIGQRPNFRVAFNVSAGYFSDDQLVGDVREIFLGSPMRMSQVVIEVTERQPLENLTAARRVIAGLQGLGCKVALDDVGSGHAGLSYILKLGVDEIKIDKIFVDAIGNERHSTAIIDMLVDLSRNMRLDVVAEGVETFEQVTFLRDHGIRLAQGFVFAPPLPVKSFLRLLDAVGRSDEDAANRIDRNTDAMAAALTGDEAEAA